MYAYTLIVYLFEHMTSSIIHILNCRMLNYKQTWKSIWSKTKMTKPTTTYRNIHSDERKKNSHRESIFVWSQTHTFSCCSHKIPISKSKGWNETKNATENKIKIKIACHLFIEIVSYRNIRWCWARRRKTNGQKPKTIRRCILYIENKQIEVEMIYWMVNLDGS